MGQFTEHIRLSRNCHSIADGSSEPSHQKIEEVLRSLLPPSVTVLPIPTSIDDRIGIAQGRYTYNIRVHTPNEAVKSVLTPGVVFPSREEAEAVFDHLVERAKELPPISDIVMEEVYTPQHRFCPPDMEHQEWLQRLWNEFALPQGTPAKILNQFHFEIKIGNGEFAWWSFETYGEFALARDCFQKAVEGKGKLSPLAFDEYERGLELRHLKPPVGQHWQTRLFEDVIEIVRRRNLPGTKSEVGLSLAGDSGPRLWDVLSKKELSDTIQMVEALSRKKVHVTSR